MLFDISDYDVLQRRKRFGTGGNYFTYISLIEQIITIILFFTEFFFTQRQFIKRLGP